MASIGTATVNIVPSMTGFTSAVTKSVGKMNMAPSGKKMGKSLSDGMGSALGSGASALSGIFGGVAASITSTLVGAVGSLTGEMVSAADGAQKFASTLDFAGVDTATIDKLTASTQAYADQTVYDLNDIRSVTAQLASNGVDNYAQLAEAAGNLNAVAGGNANTFQSVGQVMTQTAGAGRLMTENWNQLTDAIPGASGALQGAMRDAGAFEGNFREAMEKGEISADEFFAAVQKLGLQDVAREAATSTSTIEGAMGNLRASVVGLGSQVVSAVTPMLTEGMTAVSGFISGIPAALAPLGQAIQTAISGGGTGGIVTAVSALMSGIGSAITTGLQGLMSTLPSAMSTMVPTILTAISSFVSSAITQLPGILLGLVGTVMTGISSFVSALAAQLPTILPQLVAAAMQAINSLVTQVLTNLPTYIGQMVQAAVQLFQGIVQAIPQVIPLVVQGIGNLVRTILTNLPSFLGQMLEAAVQLFTGIVQAIPQVVPAVLDGIADLLGQLWDAVTSFDLLGAGADLIQGLIDGIASMAGAVIDAIGSVVGDAIEWGKDLLGIGSPSKLFRQFGDWTMQGLALGIGDGSKDAVGAMNSVMRDVYGATGAGSSLRVSPEARASSGSPMATQTVNNYYNTTVDGTSTARIQRLLVELLDALYPVGVM